MARPSSPRTLLRGAAELANAANGVRAFARGDNAGIPAFVFGWPTSELAPWLLGASVLDAGRRARRGAFRGPAGVIALLMTVASWALLLVSHRRNVESGPRLEDALREMLGADYAAAPPASRFDVSTRVFRTALARRQYVQKADTVQYGPDPRANLLEVWRRRDLPRDGRAPVMLNVPGGGWMMSDHRRQAHPLLGHLAAQGWVCVSIGYRVSPRNAWPAHIEDVKRAVAWVRENIAGYGGDPDFIAISGGSAGGHLASLCALTPNDPAWQPGFEHADTSVAAAVPIYGRYDWVSTDGPGRAELVGALEKYVVKKDIAGHRDTYENASPVHHVRADAPPFFVLHGSNDSLIPVGEAREFVAALRDASESPVGYAELPGAQHAFDTLGSPRGHNTAVAVQRFLDWTRTRAAAEPDTDASVQRA